MARIDDLRSELTADPIGTSYSTMTDREVAESLNAKTRSVQRTTLEGAELFNAIVPSEYQSVQTARKDILNLLLGVGGVIDVGPGTNARKVILDAFGAQSITVSNLIAVLTVQTSRAEELGLGAITHLEVAEARRG